MSQNPDFSEGFYRSHAQRYAEVSHGFVQSIYLKASHPGLKGDTDLMDWLQELFPVGSRGLDAGCGAGARDVFFYWQKGYDVYGVDSIDENVEEARRLHPEIAQRVSVADLRKPLGHPDASLAGLCTKPVGAVRYECLAVIPRQYVFECRLLDPTFEKFPSCVTLPTMPISELYKVQLRGCVAI